jgi:hypothetical protein
VTGGEEVSAFKVEEAVDFCFLWIWHHFHAGEVGGVPNPHGVVEGDADNLGLVFYLFISETVCIEGVQPDDGVGVTVLARHGADASDHPKDIDSGIGNTEDLIPSDKDLIDSAVVFLYFLNLPVGVDFETVKTTGFICGNHEIMEV